MLFNCHTYFSLNYGCFEPDQLVEAAAALGHSALALTDINNTSAGLDFYKTCTEKNIHPVLGIEFRKGDELLYVGLARNNKGYEELCRLLSKKLLNESELPASPPNSANCYFILPWQPETVVETLPEQHLIGIQPHQLNKLVGHPLAKHMHKLVAWQPATFPEGKQWWNVHRILRAIAKNKLISHLQPHELANTTDVLQSPEAIATTFERFPKLVAQAQQLLQQCKLHFEYGKPKNRKTFTGTSQGDTELLHKLAFDGLEYRYGLQHKLARQRVEKELKIINELGFSAYFLITWDIIRYARSRGFFHVGRGSGANSIVAYCMQITDVCPIELDLYFERFINPHRTSPPDFDIDFSWDERDTIIDYIFKRYGREHTAQIATYNTYKGRSIVREMGKVFGLPKEEIDAFIANPHDPLNDNQITRAIVKYGKLIEKFPRYLSIHAGGIIITEEPLFQYTALEMMPKGFPIVHWDMYVAEDIGFYKYDILSQRGLGHIKEAVDIIRQNRQVSIDIHDMKRIKQDKAVRAQLYDGNALGCFYVESPAMRGLLKKLRCNDYLTLVAASSIIRPGVAQSGMMKAYIYRFHNPDKFTYLHPVMETLLKETYGVMVYQEDVIKVAHHFAGVDLADADILRRAMSGKYRSKNEMQRITNTFFANCAQRGYPEAIAKEVWRQIESFSGYSFSKAHSASFAVESFQSLYLKAYYPLEFMVAVINNFGGFYRTEIYVHEARMMGATIKAPCVNHSNRLTCIKGTTVWLGLIHVQGLENNLSQQLLTERAENGLYLDLYDFIKRTHCGLEQAILLIRVGAFAFTEKSKQALLWEAHLFINGQAHKQERNELFETVPVRFALPEFHHDPVEDAWDELELLGFSLCSPFELLKTQFRGEVKAKNMLQHLGETVRMVGYLVTTKPVTTVTRQHMAFGCFLDADGFPFDTVHFPETLKQWPFKGRGCYLLKGKLVEEFGFPMLEVTHMTKLEWRSPQHTQPNADVVRKLDRARVSDYG